jgi:hypothetical protein
MGPAEHSHHDCSNNASILLTLRIAALKTFSPPAQASNPIEPVAYKIFRRRTASSNYASASFLSPFINERTAFPTHITHQGAKECDDLSPCDAEANHHPP